LTFTRKTNIKLINSPFSDIYAKKKREREQEEEKSLNAKE
jgi:hypothetical protein